jgi:hypothetical protein
MCRAFPDSDYYDSPALHISLQPQLVQSSDRDMEFPRSQDALFQSKLGFRYIPLGWKVLFWFPIFVFPPPLKCTPLSRQKNRELKVEALPTKKCLLPAFVTQRIPVEVFGNSMPDDAFECYRT